MISFFLEGKDLKIEINTPLKIDMEHNHGVLEDHVPF